MAFLQGVTALLVFQLVGEVTARLFGLPIPGPVLGMILLFASLLLLRRTPEALDVSADHLLTNLSLLFVPAGVGVVLHLQLIRSEWFPIVVTLFASTLAGMAATAWVMQWALGRARGRVAGDD